MFDSQHVLCEYMMFFCICSSGKVKDIEEKTVFGEEANTNPRRKNNGNLLIASVLHVVLLSHDEDSDLTVAPASSPGEQVGHQQGQTLDGRKRRRKTAAMEERKLKSQRTG